MSDPLPILYDFWAPWCGPCMVMKPNIDTIETEYAGKFTVQRVNIDDGIGLATTYAVRSIPTLVLVRGGVQIMRLVGTQNLAALRAALDKALATP